MLGFGNKISYRKSLISGSGYPLPESGIIGQQVASYKYPVVASLPTPVVNGQSWVLDGSPDVEYLGRYAGKFDPNGTIDPRDSVRVNVNFDPNQNYTLKMCGWANNDQVVSFNGIFCHSINGGVSNRGLWLERNSLTTSLNVNLYYGVLNLNVAVPNFFTGQYFELEIRCVSKIHTVIHNGVVIGSMNASALTINNTGTNIQIGSQFAGSRCLNGTLCKCKLVGNVSFDYDFDAGSGTTIIDKSGNGNNAILIDGSPATFWTPTWVPQPSITYALYQWKGVFRNEGTDFVNCGRPLWLNKLRPSIDSFTVRLVGSHKDSGYFASLAIGTTLDRQIMLGCIAGGETSNDFIGAIQVQVPIIPNVMLDRVISVSQTDQKYFINGVFLVISSIGSTLSTENLTIGALSDGGDNLEGDIALVEFYEGANADGTLDGLTLLDRYDFDKWDGSGSGVSEKGFPFTVTDGTPFTAKSYAWIPQII